jgi:hypothetical protein
VRGLFLLKCGECVHVFFALCIELAGDVVYGGGTCSFQIYKSGIYISLIGVEVFFNCLYRSDEFIQELLSSLGFSLVAEERLMVGVD